MINVYESFEDIKYYHSEQVEKKKQKEAERITKEIADLEDKQKELLKAFMAKDAPTNDYKSEEQTYYN